jgi:hypothetical protein
VEIPLLCCPLAANGLSLPSGKQDIQQESVLGPNNQR